MEEKNTLTKTYTFKNFHQRDALAAALKALEHYRAKFNNVNSRLQEKNLLKHLEPVKYLVLKGYTVEKAIELLEQEPKPKPVDVQPEHPKESPPSDLQKRIQELVQTVERLTEYKTELELQIKTLQTAVDDAQRELRLYDRETRKEVIQSEVVRSRESTIKKLIEELYIEKEKNKILFQENKILKEMQILEYSQKALPVKVLPHFSKEDIKALDHKIGIQSDDIIYLKDSSGGGTTTARELIVKGIRAVVTHERMSHLAEEEFTKARIPVFSSEELNLKSLGNFGVIDKDQFESVYSHWKTRTELKEAKLMEEQLKVIIEEYKGERIKNGTEVTE